MRRKNDRLQSKKVHTTETPPAQPKTAAAALARIRSHTDFWVRWASWSPS